MSDLGKAIQSLRPNAIWVLRGDEYSGIEWLDTKQTKPTESELKTEAARLQAEELANEYKAKRAAEYPSIIEQLDTLYHEGYDGWKAQIQVVKERFPK